MKELIWIAPLFVCAYIIYRGVTSRRLRAYRRHILDIYD